MRDFGAVHQRLAPGFAIDARLEGDARIVTFHNGTVARELLVDCGDARRRLVYAVISERVKHYSASVQVAADGAMRTRMIWIVDVLPNEIAPYIAGQMDQAVLAMQKHLGRATTSSAPMWSFSPAAPRPAHAEEALGSDEFSLNRLFGELPFLLPLWERSDRSCDPGEGSLSADENPTSAEKDPSPGADCA